MISNSLVSIIIPTYNRRELIKETLTSIQNQTYKNWECIIVDDGSTDNTKEEVIKFTHNDNRFAYYKRPPEIKKGANACRNYGFKKAKGKYIQWFDSDDLMHVRMLEEKINKIHNYDYVLCNMGLFKNNINEVKSKELTIDKSIIIDFFTGKIPFNTPMSFWRKKTIDKFRFNENLKRSQEKEFHLRVLGKSPNYFYLEKPLFLIRLSTNGGITTNFKSNHRLQMSDMIYFDIAYKTVKSSKIKNKVNK